jgi:hypothetical protein
MENTRLAATDRTGNRGREDLYEHRKPDLQETAGG